jgi:hypothetical protein
MGSKFYNPGMVDATREDAVEALMARAWFVEVLASSGKASAWALSKVSDAAGKSVKWDYYRTGQRVPSPETRAEAKVMLGGDALPDRAFETGPDGLPLWAVLSGDRTACLEALDAWMGAYAPTEVSDPTTSVFLTLSDRILRAFDLLGQERPGRPGAPPAFLYPSVFGKDGASGGPLRKKGPFPVPDPEPGPDALTGVMALRSLSLDRKEFLLETAWLMDCVRPYFVPAFAEWGIGSEISALAID